jgi:predicted MFS family arabinose efflux permease
MATATRTTVQEHSARRGVPAAPVLVAAVFATQSGVFVLPPMLPRLAATFDVSVGAVGQLRAVSALVAALTPLVLAPVARRCNLRDLITWGLVLGAAGSAVAALAWNLGSLVAAHVLLGIGLALALSACLAASATWAEPGGEANLLSWTTTAMGAAAVVATPVAGALVVLDWRAAWLLPLGTGLLAICLVRTRPAGPPPPARRLGPGDARTWRHPGVAGWLAGELLAYAGWSVVTVYSAALLMKSYGVGPLLAGAAVSVSAAAYMVGNRLTRRLLDHPRPVLAMLALAMAAAGGAFGLVRVGFAASVLLLTVVGLLNGGRSPAGSARGLQLAPEARIQVMAARTSVQSVGYLTGAAVGGLALAARGYDGLGALSAVMFGVASLPHLGARRRRSAGPRRWWVTSRCVARSARTCRPRA